jgi:hypothetical protein
MQPVSHVSGAAFRRHIQEVSTSSSVTMIPIASGYVSECVSWVLVVVEGESVWY